MAVDILPSSADAQNTLKADSQNTLKADSLFDIVIAGGGTVGSTLALALAQLGLSQRQLSQRQMAQREQPFGGLKIAVIEAQPTDRLYSASQAPASPFSSSASIAHTKQGLHPGFDNRAIALSRHSLDFLNHLGIGDQINEVTEAIHDIHVSDQHHLGQSVMRAASLSVKEPGRVIELPDLGRILQRALNRPELQPFCQWYCPDRIANVQVERDVVKLSLHSQQHIETSLLLVTEGGNSATRAQLPVQTQHYDYQQSAVIVNVEMSQPHQNRAFERFTEHGPLAFLPMTQNRCSVVWTVARTQESEMAEWSDEQFCAELQSAFGYRLGSIIKVGKRHVYPLSLKLSDSEYLHRAALLGNAAQMLHPIAGQGFNLGLRDVEAMVKVIKSALIEPASCADYGEYTRLSQFRSSRKQDAANTILATHGLVHLFSNNEILPVVGRNIGLFCLDKIPLLKRWFGLQAMGINRQEMK